MTSVKALLARRKKFDREDHAERVRLAILEIDVDGLKDAVQSSLPNLTANERDKLVIEEGQAIPLTTSRGRFSPPLDMDSAERPALSGGRSTESVSCGGEIVLAFCGLEEAPWRPEKAVRGAIA
jgi:hypothetical protein